MIVWGCVQNISFRIFLFHFLFKQFMLWVQKTRGDYLRNKESYLLGINSFTPHARLFWYNGNFNSNMSLSPPTNDEVLNAEESSFHGIPASGDAENVGLGQESKATSKMSKFEQPQSLGDLKIFSGYSSFDMEMKPRKSQIESFILSLFCFDDLANLVVYCDHFCFCWASCVDFLFCEITYNCPFS